MTRYVSKDNLIRLQNGQWFDKGLASLELEWDGPGGKRNQLWKTPGGTKIGRIFTSHSDMRGDSWIEESWSVLTHEQLGEHMRKCEKIPVEYLDTTKEIK